MTKIKLSDRLQAIASFVSCGSKVADIGTDHGYIPVWLAQNNIADRIVAADINKGPLEHAKKTAAEFNVSDQIIFKLCSGLSFSNSEEYDTIIIAGMGGELISSIIEAAPWTKNNTTLILQPNTKIPDLIEWLVDNGYTIQNVKLVKEAGKYYQILIVSAGEADIILNEAERLIHRKYFELRDPLLAEYIDHLLIRYKHAEQGMLSAKEKCLELEHTQSLISNLEKMKSEINLW